MMLAFLGRRILPPFFLLLPFFLASASNAFSQTPSHTRSEPAPLQEANRIRVRIAEAAPSVMVRGFDLRILSQADRKSTQHFNRMSEWEFRCQAGRVRALSASLGKSLDFKEPATVQTEAGFVSFQGRPYREELRIFSNGSLCEVINVVDIESYLDGLVNAEFSSKWADSSIDAQVVAARSYALHQSKIARAMGSRFDVDSTTMDQVYDGSMREDSRASQSVDRTHGKILIAENATIGPKAPIKAFYHSTCGGATELPQNVWGKTQPGFKKGVSCPYCKPSPAFEWKVELSSKEIAEAMLRGSRENGVPKSWPAYAREALNKGTLTSVQPLSAPIIGSGATSRVGELLTLWSYRGGVVALAVPAAQFRLWIGPARVKSTAFSVRSAESPLVRSPAGAGEKSGSGWIFTGRGNGHGVGMCQWGAKVMGEKGFSMASILKYYYPGAVLKKLW